MKQILLAASVLAILSACGGQDEPATPPAGTTVTPPAPAPTPTPAPTPPPAPTVDPVIEATYATFPAPYNEASYSTGRRLYKQCQTCHILEEDGGNLVGPNLHGMFGRTAGSLEDYNYSKALREVDFLWTPELVDEWLANPRGFLPNNKMSFAGYRRPAQRRDVIAYLMLETGWTAPEVAPPTAE